MHTEQLKSCKYFSQDKRFLWSGRFKETECFNEVHRVGLSFNFTSSRFRSRVFYCNHIEFFLLCCFVKHCQYKIVIQVVSNIRGILGLLIVVGVNRILITSYSLNHEKSLRCRYAGRGLWHKYQLYHVILTDINKASVWKTLIIEIKCLNFIPWPHRKTIFAVLLPKERKKYPATKSRSNILF